MPSITYSYQWQRDNEGGLVYGSISGATSDTYTLTTDDLGCNVRCAVTATYLSSSAVAYSNATFLTDGGLVQAAPTSGSSIVGFTFFDQLYATGATGAVTWTQVTGYPDLYVSSTGLVEGDDDLGYGTYTASGTMEDEDGHTGVWSYTLTLTFTPTPYYHIHFSTAP